MYTEQLPTSTQFDHPRYLIETKRGLRPYNLQPGEEVPFAVMYRGQCCLVVRAATDAEYFTDHPEAAWRFTAYHRQWHLPGYFDFEIVTSDGSTVATGDLWDVYGKLGYCGGSPRERLRRAARRLLTDPNRARSVPVVAA